MKDYTDFLNWALVYFIDRKTQDDHRSKIEIEALFRYRNQAEYYAVPNPEHRRPGCMRSGNV